uniref:Uncharacterized protein n=1 Tax=Ditylenchus dipsaci TaxID=166011 RepID=A0A915E9Y0_9BILA
MFQVSNASSTFPAWFAQIDRVFGGILFVVEEKFNKQNVRIIAKDIGEASAKGRIVSRIAHPKSVMVWAGITSTGKTPLVFVEEGVKVNAANYREKSWKKRCCRGQEDIFDVVTGVFSRILLLRTRLVRLKRGAVTIFGIHGRHTVLISNARLLNLGYSGSKNEQQTP